MECALIRAFQKPHSWQVEVLHLMGARGVSAGKAAALDLEAIPISKVSAFVAGRRAVAGTCSTSSESALGRAFVKLPDVSVPAPACVQTCKVSTSMCMASNPNGHT